MAEPFISLIKSYQRTLKQACIAGCTQTPSDATQEIGKIHLFSKIAVTFEPIAIMQRGSLNKLMTTVIVEQPLASPGSDKKLDGVISR